MVKKPSVFLMDEPLSNLDAKLRVQMRVELIELHNKLKTTFVYVTHDQVEAMSMADTIVLMNQGKIQQMASPEVMYKDPDQSVHRPVHRFSRHERSPSGCRRQKAGLPSRAGHALL